MKFHTKRSSANPEVSTASLPDIIFMLLFFFMVVTVLRESSMKVKIHLPEASQLTKLEQKSLVNHIYVGSPLQEYVAVAGTAPRIQLGDKFATVDDIPQFLQIHKTKVPEAQHGLITSSFHVDGEATMGIVTDVKQQLRKQNQLKVSYAARTKMP